MLNRLGQSHFAIIPPEIIPTFSPEEPKSLEPDDSPEEEVPEVPSSNGLNITEQMTHGIGIDIRIINGAAVITRVEPMSSAERAGLRPGFVLKSVNGHRMSTILRLMNHASVYQPMVKHQLPTEIVVGYFNGLPGTYARVSYLDARNILRRVNVKREKLKGEMSPPLPSLPPQFVEFESKRLRNGIGYIRFNVFAVPRHG
jgi:C-terminal processing protease CtpA/Prc